VAKTTKGAIKPRLADAPDEKRFWLADGRYLKNLDELAAALRDMSAETFAYHVNEGKNDFAIWVRDVFGDNELAAALLKAAGRAQSARTVADRVAFIKSRR